VKKILVAGATGQLGREVVRELRERGYWTRALVRDKGRARTLGADELFEGDVTRPETLRGACEGIDAVFSSVGASLSTKRIKGGQSFTEVDYKGNKNLLDAALDCGINRFVYVSVFSENLSEQLEYIRAHKDFERELARSGVNYTVLRPTGFFSAFLEILEMARRGIVPLIGESRARVNPIHEADLARVAVDALESGALEVNAGGAEVLTRREIVELAFKALGRKTSAVKVPPKIFGLMLPLIRLYDKRLHALFDFFLAVNQADMVAPAHGTRRLGEFFAASNQGAVKG
jgi:uncharacterized protein YbjT (DUF2867 family)